MAENKDSSQLTADERKKQEKKLTMLLNHFKMHPYNDTSITEETIKCNLVSETRGFGNRDYREDEAELKRIEQEKIDYMPRSKKVRTEEVNMEYACAKEETEKKISSNIKLEDVKMEIAGENYCDEDDSKIYNNPIYNFFNHKYNKELPIFEIKDSVLEALEKTNIVIIQGNTGTGKTTQVPQIILDDNAKKMQNCRIVVTQPRKIAAKSIARRVCDERKWELGTICGYKVSLDVQASNKTKITYLTTGYLLEQFINNPEILNFYTHIIIDEIHDREIDTDLIILFVKIFLLRKSTIKIILMSATLDPKLYIDYFAKYATNNYIPVLKCKNVLHKVTEYFLGEQTFLAIVIHLNNRIEFSQYLKVSNMIKLLEKNTKI